MSRRAGGSGSGGVAPGGIPGFRGAEQSLHLMTQVREYFSHGMDHVLEVAADMEECGVGKGDPDLERKLKQMMLSYARMERDSHLFMTATQDVIQLAAEQDPEEEEEGCLERLLQEHLEKASKHNNDHALKSHDKYVELEEKLSPHPTLPAGSAGMGSATPLQEDDVEMTQEQVNTRCPYTGKEMVEPVMNIHCRHAYDKAGILVYVKQRGKKALCPVSACSNRKPITAKDLKLNKELLRFIQDKNRPRSKTKTATQTRSAAPEEPHSSSGPCDTQPSESNAVVIHEG